MRHRLLKEFRPLSLAWGIGSIAAVGALCASWELLGGVSTAVFVVCMSTLAALPFGAEFQQRTMSLLLAQPLDRMRVWTEKMLLVLALFAGTGVLCAAIGHQDKDRISVCALLLTTACSTPFWVFVARSTIGGATLSVAFQFLVAGTISVAVEKIRGSELRLEHSGDLALIIIGIVAYSAVFLFLGWRKFARLELRDAFPGEGTVLSASGGEARWSGWLRCRVETRFSNLVRKELRLQKPVFLVVAVLGMCWLVTWAVYLVEPGWEEYIGGTLNVLTAIQVVLVPVLAGCMSLGEEKALGISAWHLTLPVTVFRQWLIKLGVGALLALGLGVVVPCVLAAITFIKLKVGLMDFLTAPDQSGNIVGLALAAGVLYLLGFWATTLLGSTVAAVLTTVAAIPILCGAIGLAQWIGHELGGLQFVLFSRFPDYVQRSDLGSPFRPVLWLLFAVAVAIVLRQSFAQFRRAQSERRVFAKYSVILLVFIFLSSFWIADAVAARDAVHRRLSLAVWLAIQSLPREVVIVPQGQVKMLTFQQLERTGKLSPAAERWLRNAAVEVQAYGVANVSRDSHGHVIPPRLVGMYAVAVVFADGTRYSCGTISETAFGQAESER
jgi:hypothetical protein